MYLREHRSSLRGSSGHASHVFCLRSRVSGRKAESLHEYNHTPAHGICMGARNHTCTSAVECTGSVVKCLHRIAADGATERGTRSAGAQFSSVQVREIKPRVNQKPRRSQPIQKALATCGPGTGSHQMCYVLRARNIMKQNCTALYPLTDVTATAVIVNSVKMMKVRCRSRRCVDKGLEH